MDIEITSSKSRRKLLGFFGGMRRNGALTHQDWIEVPDGSVITKEGCKVYFPVSWTECGLASVGDDIRVLGFFAVVYGKQFSVGSAMSSVRFTPATVNIIKTLDEDYYELTFDQGGLVMDTTSMVIDDTTSYRVYKRFIEMGKIPVYMDSLDIITMFKHVAYCCGSRLGDSESVLTLISSSVLRDAEDLTKPLNLVQTTPFEHGNYDFAVVPFRDVQYGATNVTAKLTGSYADIAINSALVNPSDRSEAMEDGLRQ